MNIDIDKYVYPINLLIPLTNTYIYEIIMNYIENNEIMWIVRTQFEKIYKFIQNNYKNIYNQNIIQYSISYINNFIIHYYNEQHAFNYIYYITISDVNNLINKSVILYKDYILLKNLYKKSSNKESLLDEMKIKVDDILNYFKQYSNNNFLSYRIHVNYIFPYQLLNNIQYQLNSLIRVKNEFENNVRDKLKNGIFKKNYHIPIIKESIREQIIEDIGKISDLIYIYINCINQHLYEYFNNDWNIHRIKNEKIFGKPNSFETTIKNMKYINNNDMTKLNQYINLMKTCYYIHILLDDTNKSLNLRNLRNHYGISMNGQISLNYDELEVDYFNNSELYHNYMNLNIIRTIIQLFKKDNKISINIDELLNNCVSECKLIYRCIENIFKRSNSLN